MKKALSLVLVVIMLMSSAVAMFAYATGAEPEPETPTTQTTPLAYDTAADGTLLYTANFASEDFTIDQALLDSKDFKLIDSDTEKAGMQLVGAFNENSMRLDNTNSVASDGKRAIGGWFEDYELENSTYTLTMTLKRTDFARLNLFYFHGYAISGGQHSKNEWWDGNGSANSGTGVGFSTVSWCDSTLAARAKVCMMYPLYVRGTNIKDNYGIQQYNLEMQYSFAEKVGEKYYAKDIPIKYVIVGGEKTSDGYTPVDVAVFAQHPSLGWMLIARDKGLSTCDYLWIGMGSWDYMRKDADDNDAYMQVSDVNIYKGDATGFTGGATGPSFKALYDAAEDGDVLFTVNGEGLADRSKAYANGYAWRNWDECYNQTQVPGVTSFKDGTFTIDNNLYLASAEIPDDPETPDVNEYKPATYGKGGMQGFSTYLPLGTDWNHGVYTMEMCYTSNCRSILGIVDSQTTRNGFVLDGNNGETTRTNYKVEQSFGDCGNFRKPNASEQIKSSGMGVLLNGDTVRKNTAESGEANVRIVFDFNNKTVSLYELSNIGDKWVKVAMFNFSNKKGQEFGGSLMFSVHAWDAGSKITVSGVKIVKGNSIGKFDFDFTNTYDIANYGDDLLSLDTQGMINEAANYENGYEWVKQATVPKVDSSDNRFISLNVATAGKQGAYTALPFGDEWDYGYYTLSFCLNNAARTKIGLFNIVDANNNIAATRVGFAFLPNMLYNSTANTTSADTEGTAYITQGRQEMYFGYADNFYYDVECGIEMITYDKFVADDKTPNPEYDAENPVEGVNEFLTDEDTLPDDPRIVRMRGGSNPNVKIEFNCEEKTITLFERYNSAWHKISAIDYSNLAEGYKLTPVFDLYAYDANSQINIKDIVYEKGFTCTHLHTYSVGVDTTDLITTGFNEEKVNELLEAYVNKYNLGGADIKWSVDGKNAVEDFEAIYNELSEDIAAPRDINIVPLVTYEEMTEAITMRGVKFTEVGEDGKFTVNFIAALDEMATLDTYKAVGFKVTRLTDSEEGVKVDEFNNIETSNVYKNVKTGSVKLDAAAIGGSYVAIGGLGAETAAEGVQVDYIVTAYVVAQDGTKTECAESMTFSFVGGEYLPTTAPLEIPAPTPAE